jgi:hypothetical protein
MTFTTHRTVKSREINDVFDLPCCMIVTAIVDGGSHDK